MSKRDERHAGGPTGRSAPSAGPGSGAGKPAARGLAHADPQALDEALDRTDLEEGDLLQLLRNRRASRRHLERIGSTPRWIRSHPVKRSVVRHPQCPLPLARRLLPHLYWQELTETSDDLRLHPTVRRQAEALLVVRQRELSLGERIALARRATRGLFAALVDGGEVRVIEGLIGNPRLIEADAVAIARGPHTPAEALARLAGHPRWSGNRPIGLALVENPRTPPQAALGVLRRLGRADVRGLAESDKVSQLIRISAQRVLDGDPSSERSGSDGRLTADD